MVSSAFREAMGASLADRGTPRPGDAGAGT
jgi:hypothetical protein